MAEIVVAQRMYQRRGTAAEWAAANPILQAGEIGIELGPAPGDPQKVKVGNGATPWSNLGYVAGGEPVELQKTATHIQWRSTSTPTWTDLVPLVDITGPQGPQGLQGPQGPPGPSSSAYFGAVFDGGGADIAVGSQCDIRVPYGCTLTKVSLLGDVAGNLAIDIRVASYASYPPVGADSIVGTNKPALVTADKFEDAALTGWTVAVPSGAVVRFNVESCTGIKRATILIEGVRT